MDIERLEKDNIRKHTSSYPLVSLVITSYNRSEFIGTAIESALAQDYPNLEIIISDNCSDDNTDEVVKEYLKDTRIRYSVNQKNIGMLSNFIKATNEIARGQYITYLSSDDYLVNEKFVSEAISRIQQYPSILLVHSINVSEILSTNERFLDFSYNFYKETFYQVNYVNGIEVFCMFPYCHSISFGGTVFNRNFFKEIRTFEGKLFSFDTQIVLQLLLLGDVSFINKETYVVRRHGKNMTSNVCKSNEYIDNFTYIEIPYLLALKTKNLGAKFLAKWREDMYFNFCGQCLINLYKVDKLEYKKFSLYLKENHPNVYKRITNQIGWYVSKIIFTNSLVGNFCLNGCKIFRRIKFIFNKLVKNQCM